MSKAPSSRAVRWLRRGLGPAVVALLLVLPYRFLLDTRWMDGDDPSWVYHATSRNVTAWVFSQHMIGFRPLTALSFCLSSPAEDWSLHLPDLLLFAVLLVVFHARLTASLGLRPWQAHLLTAFLGLHPVTAEIVPILSRRGDLLVAILGFLYLEQALRASRWRWPWLVLALASKETAFLLLPAAFLYWTATRGPRRALRPCFPDLLLVASMFALRLLVLDGPGGYATTYLGPRSVWIPADHLLNILCPHLPALALGSVWLAVAAVGLVGAAAIFGRAAGRPAIPFAGLVLGELVLFVSQGVMEPRLALSGVVCFLFVAGMLLKRSWKLALPCMALALLWSILHLASHPFESTALRGSISKRYLGRLESSLADEPAQKMSVFLADIPASRLLRPLERRPSWFRGSKAGADDPLGWATAKAPLCHPLVIHRALKQTQQQPVLVVPIATVLAEELPFHLRSTYTELTPGEARLEFVARGCRVEPVEQVIGRSATERLDLSMLHRPLASEFLFVNSRETEDPLVPLPQALRLIIR